MNSSTSKPTIFETFLLGLIALLPLALTVIAIGWFAGLLEQLLGPESSVGRVLTVVGVSFIDSRILAYLSGVLLVLLLIYVLGLLLRWGLGKRLQGLISNLVRRIPVVGNIYDLANRFVGVLGAKDDPALKSMMPAWCFFGGEGGTAVLALLPNPEPIEIHGFEYYGILVPSAPVPVGGGLLFVPKDWVKPADIGMEGLTSIYLTMGVSAPSMIHGTGKVKQDTI